MIVRVDGPRSGAANMALDEALLHAAATEGISALRLYSWDQPTLSFGRNEPATRRYDRDAITRLGIATVRRPTGGRAVWHDREVTYAVSGPVALFGSLRDTYREIHSLLAEALNSLGAAVSLAADRTAAPLGAGACFAAPAGGEVVAAGGAKVVGSAQVRVGGAFLQHGSILLHSDQRAITGLTRGPAPEPRAVGLADLIGGARAVFAAVAGAVASRAIERWGAGNGGHDWPESVRSDAAGRLERFAGEEWTWRL